MSAALRQPPPPRAMLAQRLVEKPWGRDVLPAPFIAPPGTRVGEIWFEPPVQLPQLLAKYIFTSDRLSIQVHPDDAQAQAAGLGPKGKEECWLVLDAEPGATVGIGFHGPLSAEAIRSAARDGSIVGLLSWHAVAAGDFFYIPAGTVHAIGAGVSLIEVQQNCDITYRLFDYGRPRALHVEAAVAVARGVPYDGALHRRLPEHGTAVLVEGPHFRLDRLAGGPGESQRRRYARAPLLVLPLTAPVRIGEESIPPGGCSLACGLEKVAFSPAGLCLIAQPCLR